jgi:hypothetical protein
MRPYFLVLALLGGTSFGTATPATPPAATPGATPAGHQALPDHEAFTRVLRDVVTVPNVDYARLKANRGGLDRYLEALGSTDPARLSAAPRSDQLAFWINAYNACMLRIVIDNYPIERQRVGLFQRARIAVAGYPANSVWQIRDVFSANHCRVAGARRSPDEIEHEIIRPRFEEPRIHFAVNCAARSCPVLWPEAYTGERLEEQLERAVRNLVASPAHFRVVTENRPALHLNKVLDWFSGDFGGVEGLRAFFLPYLEGETLEQVRDPATPIRFFEYDWTLNDASR